MKPWEMFGCAGGLEVTLKCPVVCHRVLSASDYFKRALCFSGLNHSGLIKEGPAVQTPTASAEQTDKWKCLFVGLQHCHSHLSIFINNELRLKQWTNALKPVFALWCMLYLANPCHIFSPRCCPLPVSYSKCISQHISMHDLLCELHCFNLARVQYDEVFFYIIHSSLLQVGVLMW